MELTPQLLTDEIDFRIAVRGYDRHEVDDFLERVAVAVGQLQSQLTKAVARAKTAEARVAELEAGGGVAATEAAPATEPVAPEKEPSTTRVEPTTPKAPPAAPVPATGGDEDLNEELRRTLVLAQRTADSAIREAHEEARQIVEEANEEARRNREAAEAAHAKAREEAHGRLVAEIRDLEATRESMRDDTVILERYLGTERARVRETIQVLRRLVDEPESFRTQEVPELSGATTPAALGPAPEPASAGADDATSAPGDTAEGASTEAAGDEGAEETTVEPETGSGPVESGADESTPDASGPGAANVDESGPGGSNPDASDPGASDAVSSEPGAAEPSGAPDAGEVAGEAPPLTQRTPGSAPAGEAASSDAAPTAVPDESSAGGEQASGAATTSDTEDLGQLFSSSESAKDWRAAGSDRGDQGPHTQPVAAARFEEESDEAFLAELRRAMNDDEPLGPDDKP